MKKNFTIILAMFLAISLSAQTETLFNRTTVIGGFGGPITEFGQFNGEFIVSSGGGGGVILDDFFIGGYGMGTMEVNDKNTTSQNLNLQMGHGGFWLGYTYKTDKLVHVFASTKLGWGNIEIDVTEGFDNYAKDNIFVITPEVGVEVNLFRWFKLAGTVGYRAVTGFNSIDEYKNSDFSGVAGTLTLRFGGFGDWDF